MGSYTWPISLCCLPGRVCGIGPMQLCFTKWNGTLEQQEQEVLEKLFWKAERLKRDNSSCSQQQMGIQNTEKRLKGPKLLCLAVASPSHQHLYKELQPCHLWRKTGVSWDDQRINHRWLNMLKTQEFISKYKFQACWTKPHYSNTYTHTNLQYIQKWGGFATAQFKLDIR